MGAVPKDSQVEQRQIVLAVQLLQDGSSLPEPREVGGIPHGGGDRVDGLHDLTQRRDPNRQWRTASIEKTNVTAGRSQLDIGATGNGRVPETAGAALRHSRALMAVSYHGVATIAVAANRARSCRISYLVGRCTTFADCAPFMRSPEPVPSPEAARELGYAQSVISHHVAALGAVPGSRS